MGLSSHISQIPDNVIMNSWPSTLATLLTSVSVAITPFATLAGTSASEYASKLSAENLKLAGLNQTDPDMSMQVELTQGNIARLKALNNAEWSRADALQVALLILFVVTLVATWVSNFYTLKPLYVARLKLIKTRALIADAKVAGNAKEKRDVITAHKALLVVTEKALAYEVAGVSEAAMREVAAARAGAVAAPVAAPPANPIDVLAHGDGAGARHDSVLLVSQDTVSFFLALTVGVVFVGLSWAQYHEVADACRDNALDVNPWNDCSKWRLGLGALLFTTASAGAKIWDTVAKTTATAELKILETETALGAKALLKTVGEFEKDLVVKESPVTFKMAHLADRPVSTEEGYILSYEGGVFVGRKAPAARDETRRAEPVSVAAGAGGDEAEAEVRPAILMVGGS